MRMGSPGASIGQGRLVFAFVWCTERRIGEFALALGRTTAEAVAVLVESGLIHGHALFLEVV